jgi:hypothetical protein
MRNESRCTQKDRARIDAALADLIAPDGLARLGLDGMNGAISPTGNQEASSVDLGGNGGRIGSVVGTPPRLADPNRLPCCLVKGKEPSRLPSMTGETVRPP